MEGTTMDTIKHDTKYELVDIKLLDEGYNPRKNFSNLENLKNSIQQEGILVPLTTRRINGHYEIVSGARRYKIAKELEHEKVPIVTRNLTDEQARHLAYIDNKERNDLNAIEEAEHYKMCQDELGMTVRDISEKYNLNTSGTEVSRRLSLLQLPDPVKEKVAATSLQKNHAYELTKLCKPDDLKELFESNSPYLENWEEQYQEEFKNRQSLQIELCQKAIKNTWAIKTLKKKVNDSKEVLDKELKNRINKAKGKDETESEEGKEKTKRKKDKVQIDLKSLENEDLINHLMGVLYEMCNRGLIEEEQMNDFREHFDPLDQKMLHDVEQVKQYVKTP